MTSEQLRERIRQLSETYVAAVGLPAYRSRGGVVLYPANQNIFHGSLPAISANQAWKDRLARHHPQRHTLPSPYDQSACELDSSNSSDALLMSIFCHPDTNSCPAIRKLFGGVSLGNPQFGFPAQIQLTGGQGDRTVLDMVLDDKVFVEAKLTEADFTEAEWNKLNNYRDFSLAFDWSRLASSGAKAPPVYQLIRLVLAARQHNAQAVVILHSERTDLINFVIIACSALQRGVKDAIRVITWQEIAEGLHHVGLRRFLELKYGI